LIPPQRAGCGYPLLLSREDFCKSVEPFGLSIVDAHAIFKLVTTRRGAKVPLQDLVTRILGGLGRQHDALRTRLGLPVSVLDDNGSAAPAQAVGGQWETSITVKNSSPTQRHQLLLKARRSTKRQRRRAESAPCERVHVTGTKEDDEARGTTSPSMVHHAARSNSFESESDAARRSGVARKRWGLPSIANRVRGVQALCGIKVKSVTTSGVRVEDNAPRDPVREGSFASHFKFGHKTFDDGLSGVDELLSAKVCRRNLPSKYVPSGGGPGAVCEAVEHFMNSAARKLASARADGARLPAVGIPLGLEDSVDDVPVPARGLLGNALRGTERPRTGQVVANAESVSASHSHDFLKVVNKASAAAHSDNDKAWNFDEGSCENPAFAMSEDPGDIELGTEPLELAAREVTECERQVQRRELFGGDAFQLEIATRKLQEVRLRFMARFRTPGRTFDSLAGSRTASVTVSVFQDRVIAWKIFNALDAKRVASLITTLGESPLLSYAEFLQILSFATPTHSLLGFRKRLVQRYGSLDAALHILGLADVEELSIDIFDRCLLALVSSQNTHSEFFSMIDAVQPNGPCGFLSLDAIRFAVDHAQVISWLGLLHGILGGGAVLRATLLATAPLEKVMSDPSELEEVVQQFGFLTMLAEPTFALLQRCGDGTVTLGGLAHVLEAAFTDSYEEVAGRSKLGGPGTVNRLAGLMDARREMSLMLLAQLRLTVLERFSNYQDAFQVFKAARLEGVTLDEWEAAMPSFQFTSPERWCLIFGHLVGWRHPRWTLAYRGSEMRISLADFAAALRTAVPCRTLSALRVRLQEVCPSVQKAWHRLSGKEGVDEIGSVQWVTALQHFGVRIADANCLFAMLQALHCIEFGTVGGASKTVARSVFLSALRASSAEAHTRLFSVLASFQDSCTPASESFEVTYPRDLVASTSFERYATQILKVSRADAGCFFWLLDTQRDGVISVDDLLDHLTTLQETYIPQTPGDITRADVRAEKLWVSLEASAKGVTGGSGVSQTRSRAQGLSLRLCPTTEIADGLNLVDSKPSQRQSAAESCAQDAPTQQPLPNFSGWKRSLVEEEGHLKPEHVEQNVALNKMSCPVVSKSSPERNPLQVLARASAPAPLKEKRGQLSTHRFLLKSSKPTLAQDDPCFPWSDSGVMVSSARGWRSTGSATAASAAAAAIIAGRPTEPSEVVEASRTALFNGLPVRARAKTKSMG